MDCNLGVITKARSFRKVINSYLKMYDRYREI